ncbi:MAG: hypothetical protein A4E73_03681 [Syntrophaceae bacterium PtaU1.Bin231]|nr:MAG: hypothetical protein A4E73_03681 [Syntrophaceae bacterium PtaU1.Bin231]HOG17808.1 DUF503 domain-containing protein [Syntrophales bacterium]
MVVGTGIVELRIPECGSLKEKRGILSRILKRVQNSFNASVAEVGQNDHLRRAVIGFSVVGNDRRYINGKMDHILNFIERLELAEVVGAKVEIVSIENAMGAPSYEEGKYDDV